MKVLVVGAGGVGSAAVGIAARRDFFDLDGRGRLRPRSRGAGDRRLMPGTPRFVAAQVDASSADAVAALLPRARASRTSSTPSIRAS